MKLWQLIMTKAHFEDFYFAIHVKILGLFFLLYKFIIFSSKNILTL